MSHAATLALRANLADATERAMLSDAYEDEGNDFWANYLRTVDYATKKPEARTNGRSVWFAEAHASLPCK
jgi:hypothetical protein